MTRGKGAWQTSSHAHLEAVQKGMNGRGGMGFGHTLYLDIELVDLLEEVLDTIFVARVVQEQQLGLCTRFQQMDGEAHGSWCQGLRSCTAN